MTQAVRWIAIAIAVAAIVDPQVSLPRSQRPVVRVIPLERSDARPVLDSLKHAGFVIDPATPEEAIVLIGSGIRELDAGSRQREPRSGAQAASRSVIWALDTAATAPNVSVTRAETAPVRFAGQGVEVQVGVSAQGVAGRTTEIVLEHNGIPVASATHAWKQGEANGTAVLRYLPPTGSATTLRVRAHTPDGETAVDDNAADVAVPAVRGSLRVLIVEAAVTWPAVFVRRALEGEPAIAVSSLQRAAKSVVTRAGDPPPSLTRSALARFEAVVIGGPDDLRAPELDALRWFVEQRGGVAIFVPDREPRGRYVEVLGMRGFTSRALENPTRLGANLQASELLVATQLPPAATILAAAGDTPVVISARRGAGAIVFSGALDAWRQRGDAYGAFWRDVLVANAAAVPPAMEVRVVPAIARPGEPMRVTARLRDIPEGDVLALPAVHARIVSPGVKVDEPIRLWPTAAPGVYEGEWRGRLAGMYDVSVSAGESRADAIATIAPSALHASQADPDALALVTAATGGRAFPAADVPVLVEAMQQAHPPQRVVRPAHPMRSPWWIVPFAGLLCAEWAVRRKRGLS